jgi:hypothetical protein
MAVLSARRLMLVGVLLLHSLVCAATAPEYQVKAAFLFNFTQFVEWPADAFNAVGSPLIIGVLGQDPFGNFLDETVRGESVNNRGLQVRRFSRVEDVDNCQVLFISNSETARLPQILDKLKGKSILTVGEADDFARRGGIIRFAMVANKIRLHINVEAAKEASLTISSKLLRPAEIVDTETQ